MLRNFTLLAAMIVVGPAFADGHAASGDAAAGEKAFRQCQSCHVVQNAAGEVLAGRASKTGPNLFGIEGMVYGSVEDFRYSDIMLLAKEQGQVHDTEADFVAYVMDPTAHLRSLTGDSSGRSKMTFKVRKEEDAVNLYAFLAQFSE